MATLVCVSVARHGAEAAKLLLLFAVFYDNIDVGITGAESFCELFGTVDRSMLSTGASETDGEVGEVAFEIFVNALGDYGEGVFKEVCDGLFVAQEFDDRGVHSCICFVFGVASWIGQCPTVEDVPATVA